MEGPPRLLAEPLCELAQRLLDRRRLPRLDLRERLVRGATDLRVGSVAAHGLEQEAHAVRVLVEALDLLLDERRARVHGLLRPLDPAPAQPFEQRVRVLRRLERPQMDTVHPVELL